MFGDGKQEIESYIDFAKRVNKKDDDKRVSQAELNRKRNLAEELERKFREKGGK